MKKITSRKLRNYSSMSAAILATAIASGQVVYTDVEDITVTPGDDTDGRYNINLNDDGTVDFSITIGEATGGLSFVTRPRDGDDVANGGAFIGVPAGNYQYPQLLFAGDDIETSSPMTDAGVRGDLNFYGCAYSNSEFCGSEDNAYLGLVFDFQENSHYGWVEMDFATDAASGSFTIKGFAFDATPEATITAGDTGLGNNDNSLNGFAQFVADGQLNLKASTAMSSVAIFDITGKQVISQKVTSTNAQVNLAGLNTGVYIATVTIEGSKKTFKFVK